MTSAADPLPIRSSRAVLMMAYGGPDSLDDIEPFLLDIRGGRPTSPELIEEIRERYEVIGGRSPLLEITRAQASALEKALAERLPSHEPIPVVVGMRHWTPTIRTAVEELVELGVDEVIGLAMAPHYSRMSIGAYFAKLEEARAAIGAGFKVRPVGEWHDHPLLLDAIEARVRTALDRFTPEERGDLEILFTAHSLPTRILDQGDPYDDQLKATAAALAERLADDVLVPWSFCYQSAGASSIPWLGPAIEDVVVEKARAGRKNLLVAPIGFVCDHVEVLFDLDVEAKGLAADEGCRLERTESLNTDPTFIRALADVVARTVER